MAWGGLGATLLSPASGVRVFAHLRRHLIARLLQSCCYVTVGDAVQRCQCYPGVMLNAPRGISERWLAASAQTFECR